MPAIVLQGRVNLQKIKVFSPNYTISADSVICIIEMLLTEYHEENKPHTSDEWERWKIKYHCCHLYSSMEGVTLSIVFVHAAVKSRVFSLLFYCISIAPFCVFIEHTTHFVFSWPRVNKASTLPYCLTPDMLELQLGDVSIAQLCSLFLSCLHPHFIWSGWLLLASLNPFFVCMCVWERESEVLRSCVALWCTNILGKCQKSLNADSILRHISFLSSFQTLVISVLDAEFTIVKSCLSLSELFILSMF